MRSIPEITLDHEHDERVSNIVAFRLEPVQRRVEVTPEASEAHLSDTFCLAGILLLVPALYLFGLIRPETVRPVFVFLAAFLVGLVLLREGQRMRRSLPARIAFYLGGFMLIAEWIAVFALVFKR